MLNTKLTKEEILKRIQEEYEALSRFTENTKDDGFKGFEKARLDYLKMLMGILEITEEE